MEGDKNHRKSEGQIGMYKDNKEVVSKQEEETGTRGCRGTHLSVQVLNKHTILFSAGY